MKVRVRYAPSPTGYLHIGNARTALFNYLFARRYEGDFIVRIEDTDVARNVDTGIENQLAYLKWLGLDWDESIDKDGGFGPYQQLERLDLYRKFADRLIEEGWAYKCYCTEEELEAARQKQIERGESRLHYPRTCLGKPDQDKPYAVRFKVPDEKVYRFNDIVKGDVTFRSEDIEDWVIMKKSRVPTYNFACAVDDALMEISHVLRGEDHITNTPKQLMVLDALDFDRPVYGHMPLIVNEEGKKLSKRDGSIIQFIEQYHQRGFLPGALFNFIALLGFSPDAKEEILSKEAIIERFEAERLSTSPATFDNQKLLYINHRYIQALNDDEALKLCRPFLDEAGIGEDRDDTWFNSLISVFKDRLNYGAQIVELYRDFFDRPFTIDEDALEFLGQEGVQALLETFHGHLKALDAFTPETIKNTIKQSGKETGMKGKMLFMPIRIAISGQMHGPDLPRMMHLIGKELLLKRLEKTIEKLG